MITYCVILLVLRSLALVFGNGETKFTVIANTLVVLPLFGRIFGWW